MSSPEHKRTQICFSSDEQLPFCTTAIKGTYKEMYDKFRATIRDKRNNRVGRSDIFAGLTPYEVQQMFVRIGAKRRRTCKASAQSVFDQPMPKPDLAPVFPNRPLNLNEDDTTITYRKSQVASRRGGNGTIVYLGNPATDILPRYPSRKIGHIR